jgi:hypothetical protein
MAIDGPQRFMNYLPLMGNCDACTLADRAEFLGLSYCHP